MEKWVHVYLAFVALFAAACLVSVSTTALSTSQGPEIKASWVNPNPLKESYLLNVIFNTVNTVKGWLGLGEDEEKLAASLEQARDHIAKCIEARTSTEEAHDADHPSTEWKKQEDPKVDHEWNGAANEETNHETKEQLRKRLAEAIRAHHVSEQQGHRATKDSYEDIM